MTHHMSGALENVVRDQDGVVSLQQLEQHGFPAKVALRRSRDGRWRKLLPGVVLCSAAPATKRQLLLAAWLWTGRHGVVDGCCACSWYGVATDGCSPGHARLVVPGSTAFRSVGFVVVRRALSEVRVGDRGLVPYVDPAMAVLVAARDARSPAAAIAVLSRGLQRGVVTTRSLADARLSIGDKYFRPVDSALLAVGAGVRSVGEEQARRLILTSRVLPPPSWNVWLDLGDGGYPVCVDALWASARLVHEINGRRFHAWDRSFENMHARQERLAAAGLVVLPTTPIRLRRHPADVLASLERAFLANDGRGLPTDVEVIPPPTWSIADMAC